MERIFCNDTREVFESYRDYLKGKHWRKLKEEYKKSEHPKCCRSCKSTEKLHLHHKTYDRIGHEKLSDLCYLCQDCHRGLHYILKQDGRLNLIHAVRNKKYPDSSVKRNGHGTHYGVSMSTKICILPEKIQKKRRRARERRFDNWYSRNCGPVIAYNLNDPPAK